MSRNDEAENLISLQDFLANTDDVLYYVKIEEQNYFAEPVQFVSRKTLNILGCAPEDFIRDRDLWIRSLHPDDVAAVTETTQLCIEKKEAVTRTYRFLHGQSGEYISLEDRIAPKYNDEGKIIALYGVARDITRRLSLEKRLLQAQKVEALGRLAAGIAHELNNVLSPIAGYPDLILMSLPEDSPLIKAVTTVREAGERASAIIQDLLTFARRSIVETEILDTSDFIAEYLESAKHRHFEALYPDIRIETHCSPDLNCIEGSRLHLSSALVNLVSNACEAMPSGGRISITGSNQTIAGSPGGDQDIPPGDYVVIALTDTGTGIPEAHMTEIFEPFYTRKPFGKYGTGLGLFIVQGIMDDHAGYIDIRSTVKEGTTVSLYLPAASRPPQLQESEPTDGSLTGDGTILIVDDSPEQRDLESQMLTSLGYKVKAVASGEEAVEYLRDTSVDLLILDMIMERGIDGIETYRRIIKNTPHQKAIVVSGCVEEEVLQEAERMGSRAFIGKPCTRRKLGLAVKEALAGK